MGMTVAEMFDCRSGNARLLGALVSVFDEMFTPHLDCLLDTVYRACLVRLASWRIWPCYLALALMA